MRRKLLLSTVLAGVFLLSGCSDSPSIAQVKEDMANGLGVTQAMKIAARRGNIDVMQYLHDEEEASYSSGLYGEANKGKFKAVVQLLYDNNVHIEGQEDVVSTLVEGDADDVTLEQLKERGLELSKYGDVLVDKAIYYKNAHYLKLGMNMQPTMKPRQIRKLFLDNFRNFTPETAGVLIESGFDPSKGYFLSNLIEYSDTSGELAIFLIESGAKIDSRAITSAIRSNKNSVVKKMVEKGIKIKQEMLNSAFQYLDADTVLTVINGSKSLDVSTAMYQVLYNQEHCSDIIRKVVAKGIPLNEDLLVGIYERYKKARSYDKNPKSIPLLKELIDQGGNINHQHSKDQWALVLLAAKFNDIDMLEYIDSKNGSFDIVREETRYGGIARIAYKVHASVLDVTSKDETLHYIYMHHSKEVLPYVKKSNIYTLIQYDDLDSLNKLIEAGFSFEGKGWKFRGVADESKVEMYAFLKQNALI